VKIKKFKIVEKHSEFRPIARQMQAGAQHLGA
jgi:hypothetical protein